jgi:hypothetical protein
MGTDTSLDNVVKDSGARDSVLAADRYVYICSDFKMRMALRLSTLFFTKGYQQRLVIFEQLLSK